MKFLTFVGALALAASITGCGTTSILSPGDPLPGVGLGASEESILLSWSTDGQLSRRLRNRTKLNILASYSTEFGSVINEVISSNTVTAGFPGLKFNLPKALKLTPLGPVCLRLAIGRKAIPLRIPKPSKSIDGFYYNEWAANAAFFTKKISMQNQLNTITRNVNTFAKPNQDFEAWRLRNNLASVSQCGNWTSITVADEPDTALQGKAKLTAARRQCVALYLKKFSANPEFSKISRIVKAVKTDNIYKVLANDMKHDFVKFSPGLIYFPGSKLPLDQSAYNQSVLEDGENISLIGAKLLIDSYGACKLEAEKRFEASYTNWKEVNSEKTIAARKKPLAKMCRARFDRDARRVDTLDELRQEKSKIEAELRLFEYEEGKLVVLPKKKLLVSHACPTTS